MNVDTHSVNVLSLCAGIGGIDLGLRLAIPAARTVCWVENEITAVEKLVARMEDGALDPAPVWTDLKTFDGKPWRGRVDILTAGYPCQPFSCAGQQRGTKDPRHLWPYAARVVGQVQPAIVFLENVENHLRIGYEQVRGELQQLGYTVTEGVFSAEEVGAPHLRKRLFILAYRRSMGLSRESLSGSARREIFQEERARNRLAALTLDRSQTFPRQLEDAAWHGEHGSLRQDGRGRRRVRQTGGGVADAGGRLLPITRRRQSGRAGTGSAGADVANADSRIAEQLSRRGTGSGGSAGTGAHDRAGGPGIDVANAHRAPSTAREESHQDRRTHETARSGDGDQQLADTEGANRRRGGPREPEEARIGRRGPRGENGLFPPGPADLAGWRELLGRDASLEPALRGTSHGPSSRVDRLRACGNSVIPLVAAYAFVSLARAALARSSGTMKAAA